MPFPPSLWPKANTRCPYCVESGSFKPMTQGDDEEWYECDRCHHVTMPGNKFFECGCLKCSEGKQFGRR